MTKTLSHIIKHMIEQEGRVAGTVANIHGNVIQSPIADVITRSSEWVIYSLPYVSDVSPDQIVAQLSATDFFAPTVVQAAVGQISFTAPSPGTYLYSTLVESPQQITFSIDVTAVGQQIAIYVDESLVKRRSNRSRVRITLNAGLTPLNIVVIGEGGPTTIVLPEDLRTVVAPYIPPVPQWRFNTPITTNYIDPVTGNTGNALFWRNQQNVGGWGVYTVNFVNHGQIQNAFFVNNKYILTTDSATDVVPLRPSLMMVNSGVLGTLERAVRTEDFDQLVLTIRPNEEDDVLEDLVTVVSGVVLQSVRFNHLTDVLRSSGEDEITFVDTNAKIGDSYSYVLDAFAAFDSSLRSTKSIMKSIVAGDILPPASISVAAGYPKVVNGLALVSYTPPSDTDYKGVNVVYSGVNVITDFGNPAEDDSFTFEPEPGSPSYDFVTFDQAGNIQAVSSGVNWVRNPSLDVFIVPNTPPKLSVTQLTETEQTSGGISAPFDDSLNYAVMLVAADDPEDGTTGVLINYKLRDGTTRTVNATDPGNPASDDIDDPSGTRTRLIAVARTERENWVQLWTQDAEGLLSATLVFTPDYDTIPEFSSVDFREDNNNDRFVISGLVDDDTKSFTYKGTETTSGTLISSGAVGGLGSLKIFSFNMPVADGTQVVLQMVPYADIGISTFSGVEFLKELNRGPRTGVKFEDRNLLGEISKTKVRATFEVIPNITPVAAPDGSGTADAGGSVTTLVDAAQSGNWTTDEFQEVGLTVFYVRITTSPAAPASDQVRKIVKNTTTVLTVSPQWASTPVAGDTYEIHKGATLFRKGTVGSFAGTFNPVEMPRDSSRSLEDRTLQFFSRLHGVPTEATQTVVVDEDDEASLLGFTASEVTGNNITVSIQGGDDDAKRWQVFARKGDGIWPTHNTKAISAGGLPDINYLRWDDDISITAFSFAAATSNFWNVIAVPMDAFNNRGAEQTTTVVVSGTGTSDGVLSNLAVAPNDDTGDDFNKISWDHNSIVNTAYDTGTATGGSTSTVENSAAPWTTNEVQTFFVEMTSGSASGDVREITSNTTTELTVAPVFSAAVANTDTYEIYQFEVKVFAYRQDRGIGTQIEITTADRGARLDVSGDFDNTTDQDTVANEGSFLHDIAELRGTSTTGESQTWKYTVELHDNAGPTLVDTYTVDHTDYWIKIVPTLTTVNTNVENSGVCPTGEAPYPEGDGFATRASWNTDDPDDTNYQVDIDVANNSSIPSPVWNVLTTGQSTNGGDFIDPYPTMADVGGGPETVYFRYRFHMVRKSDLVKIQTIIDTQLSITDMFENVESCP